MRTATCIALLCAPLVALPQFLDPGFGENGVVHLDVDGSFEQFFEVVAQADGGIVAVGHANVDSDLKGLIARYTSQGELDTEFMGTGYHVFDVGGADTELTGVALFPDGRIVCSGSVGSGSSRRPAAFLFSPNGQPDPDFGSAGASVFPGTTSGFGEDVAVTVDGKVVVVGGLGGNIFAARYWDTGLLDETFNGDGWMDLDLGGSERAYSVGAQGDAMVVACYGDPAGGPVGTVWAKRITEDGEWDATFGDEGSVMHGVTQGGKAFDVFTRGDGAILLSGLATTMGMYSEAVNFMLDADGHGDGAIVTETAPDEEGRPTKAYAGWLMNDGRAIVAATEGEDVLLIGLSASGALDPGFGDQGLMRAPGLALEDGSNEDAAGLWVEPNGRALYCGRSRDGGDAFVAAFMTGATGLVEGPVDHLKLHPNPATDQLVLPWSEAGAWRVHDALGRAVLQGVQPGSGPLILSVAELPPGTYRFVQHGASRSAGASFVVQR